MRKILVIGSHGMAGHMITEYFREEGKFQVYTLARSKAISNDENHYVMDVYDQKKLSNVLSLIKPEFVINCVGILVQASAAAPQNAIYINAFFPQWLKQQAEKFDFKLIHISTDCVFSGNKGKYVESDFCDEDNFYGRSKALGEIDDGINLTIRTSIVGPELKDNGTGLFHWFMSQQGIINGYSRSIWSGVTTLELAKAISFFIESGVTGLVHLTNGASISKYKLLLLFQEAFHKIDVKVEPSNKLSCDKSILCSRKDVAHVVPSYRNMVEEMHDWMNVHGRLYRHEKYTCLVG